MNTQQYYRICAHSFLNGSIAALIPIFIFILPFFLTYQQKEILIFSIPFFLYSLFSIYQYFVNIDKAEKIEIQGNITNLEDEHSLLLFLPAPTLYMVFYNSEGIKIGEVRDQYFWKIRWFFPYFIDRIFPCRYQYFNKWGELEATITHKKGNIIVETSHNKIFIWKMYRNHYIIKTGKKEWKLWMVKERLFLDIQFLLEEGQLVGRVRKGWMPLKWDKIIKDPNTPVLTIDEKAPSEIKYALLGILSQLYRNFRH